MVYIIYLCKGHTIDSLFVRYLLCYTLRLLLLGLCRLLSTQSVGF